MNANRRLAVLNSASPDDLPGTAAPGSTHRLPDRAGARTAGVLFLSAFLAYGIGSSIATSLAGSGAERSDPLFVAGAAAMLLNSALVIGIGALLLPILRPHGRGIAVGYLGTRIFEGAGLAAGVVSLVVLAGPAALDGNFLAYNVAMAGLGIGSLFFCALLFRSKLVPGFLAAWGFIGYACFAAGSLLELGGIGGAGLLGAAPAGLFEVAFGIWLIVRGFRADACVGGSGGSSRALS